MRSVRPTVMTSLFSAVALAGCVEPQTPESALSAFLEDTERGAWQPAAERLSENSLAWLRARRAEVAGPEAESGPEALFETLQLRVDRTPQSIVVVSPIGDRVTLRATVEDGRSAEFPMVKEDGAWKVDLARALARE